MLIKLIRHAESEQQAGLVKTHEVPNHSISITEKGVGQALDLGKELGKKLLSTALLYQSPYLRTRQTMRSILFGAGFKQDNLPRIYEDVRLREVDHGYEDTSLQIPKRVKEGFFWYRFEGGESPADCFDRTATFLDSMMRQLNRKQKMVRTLYSKEVDYRPDVVIVAHSLIIRCFIMRFMHLTVEQFDVIDSIPNCGVVTIGSKRKIKDPQFISGQWAITGVPIRAKS